MTGPVIGTISSSSGGFGFIHYKAGSVWAGRDDLYTSKDSGATWTLVPNLFTGVITEINFFDDQIGVISTTTGIYKTTNAGATWSLILNRSNAYGVQFAGSPSRIVAATDGGSSGFYYSTDGGSNWNYASPGGHPHFVLAYPNGTAYGQTGSSIYFTSDFGVTWQAKGGIDYDSWYLVQDSSSYLYLMNEEGHVFSDNLANFCRSNDGALTWQKTTSFTPQYYTGGLSVSKCAVYCQTLANGVVSSTDHGSTWTSIGGPDNFIDTRLVCAINSQIVIAADGSGQLWRTVNRGGVPIPDETARLTSTKPKVINISVCDFTDIIPIELYLSSSCSGYDLYIISAVFEGLDPAFFSVTSKQPPFVIVGNTGSTMIVRFTAPDTAGNYSSILHLTGYYRDAVGNTIQFDTTIILNATVNPAPPELKSNVAAVIFPSVTPCDRERDTTVTLTNTGCDTLTILSGPGILPPGFSFDPLQLPIILPPGGSVTVHFYFDPKDSGSYKVIALFEGESNGIKQTVPITLTGRLNGALPQLIAKDSVVAFRAMTLCDPEVDTTITLTNVGCDTLLILSGPGALAPGFSIDPMNFPVVLAPGESTTIRVHFLPQGIGNYRSTASYAVSSKGEYSTLELELSGVGKGKAPQLHADQTALDFGTVSTCDKPQDTTIVLTNVGCDTLVITSGPGTLPPGFSMSSIILPVILPPDSSITLHFSFYPSASGNYSATPSFLCERDGFKGNVTFLLSGTGSEGKGILTVEQLDLRFVDLSICSSDSLDGTIMNTGCDTLIIDEITLAGDADFVGQNPLLPRALAFGDRLGYRVYLSPQAKGAHVATVTVRAHTAHGSQTSSTKTIPVYGIVTDGTRILAMTPDTLGFGTTTICDNLDSILTLFNRGCDTITITDVNISGSGFLVDTTLPLVLLPGEKINVRIVTLLDTTDGVLSNNAAITFIGKIENVVVPIVLRRDYQYPKRYTVELAENKASDTAGDLIRFDLRTNDDLVGVSELDLDLAYNSDLLTFASADGPNRITFVDGHIHITGSPIVASNGVIGSLVFIVYLTKDSVTDLTISNLQCNSSDPYFERCIASIGGIGSDFTYTYHCGERLLEKYMSDEPIFSIVSLRPNPTNGDLELVLYIEQPTDLAITIYDALGKKVFNEVKPLASGAKNLLIDANDLESGIYYLEAASGTMRRSSSFIKTR